MAGAVVALEVEAARLGQLRGDPAARALDERAGLHQRGGSGIGTTRKAEERNELYGVIPDAAKSANGCTFKVQGVPVQATSTTLCASIADGDDVEAKGRIVNGVLDATRIEFEG